ncbi:hypothetical protein BJX62DRAFT_242408 [Aspergillus germanicus]
MSFYKDLSCLSNPKAFPSFAELSRGSSLTPAYLELGESEPIQFFFCKFVKILDRTHYRSEIEVKDKTGKTVRLALCFGELQDYMLPFKFEEECETLLLLNPKRTILRDDKTEGIEITDPSHIKVLHAPIENWDNMRRRIIEANSEQMEKICSNCGKKSYKVKWCMWCRLFSYCNQRCLKEDHADECDVLRDRDIHKMFTGEWDVINFFVCQGVAQTGPRE